jgi:hypothetical protein
MLVVGFMIGNFSEAYRSDENVERVNFKICLLAKNKVFFLLSEAS